MESPDFNHGKLLGSFWWEQFGNSVYYITRLREGVITFIDGKRAGIKVEAGEVFTPSFSLSVSLENFKKRLYNNIQPWNWSFIEFDFNVLRNYVVKYLFNGHAIRILCYKWNLIPHFWYVINNLFSISYYIVTLIGGYLYVYKSWEEYKLNGIIITIKLGGKISF